MNEAMNKTKLKFVMDFREKPVQVPKKAAVLEMSIGELLYWVLMGEDSTPVQEA
jgi:hypothetical protein